MYTREVNLFVKLESTIYGRIRTENFKLCINNLGEVKFNEKIKE